MDTAQIVYEVQNKTSCSSQAAALCALKNAAVNICYETEAWTVDKSVLISDGFSVFPSETWVDTLHVLVRGVRINGQFVPVPFFDSRNPELICSKMMENYEGGTLYYTLALAPFTLQESSDNEGSDEDDISIIPEDYTGEYAVSLYNFLNKAQKAMIEGASAELYFQNKRPWFHADLANIAASRYRKECTKIIARLQAKGFSS